MNPKHEFGLKGPLSEPTTEKASKQTWKHIPNPDDPNAYFILILFTVTVYA